MTVPVCSVCGRQMDSHGRDQRVWIANDPRQEALRAVFDVWWDETRYPKLRLDGWLANTLPPWDIHLRPVSAAVLHPDHTPYCTSSPDTELSNVLTRLWDPEGVLQRTTGRATPNPSAS